MAEDKTDLDTNSENENALNVVQQILNDLVDFLSQRTFFCLQSAPGGGLVRSFIRTFESVFTM